MKRAGLWILVIILLPFTFGLSMMAFDSEWWHLPKRPDEDTIEEKVTKEE